MPKAPTHMPFTGRPHSLCAASINSLSPCGNLVHVARAKPTKWRHYKNPFGSPLGPLRAAVASRAEREFTVNLRSFLRLSASPPTGGERELAACCLLAAGWQVRRAAKSPVRASKLTERRTGPSTSFAGPPPPRGRMQFTVNLRSFPTVSANTHHPSHKTLQTFVARPHHLTKL
jgi:hypothetical protein